MYEDLITCYCSISIQCLPFFTKIIICVRKDTRVIIDLNFMHDYILICFLKQMKFQNMLLLSIRIKKIPLCYFIWITMTFNLKKENKLIKTWNK